MAIALLIFKQFSVKNIHCQVVWQHMQGVMGVLMTFYCKFMAFSALTLFVKALKAINLQ